MKRQPWAAIAGLATALLVVGVAVVVLRLRSTMAIPRSEAAGPVPADSAYLPAVAQARRIIGPLSGRYPGISVAVGIRDTLVWTEALGYADVGWRVKATPATAFRAYSVAKALTGTALLRLRQDGKIDLDAPAGRYLRGLPDDLSAVTMGQLAGHLSGIRDYRSGEWLPLSSRPCDAGHPWRFTGCAAP